MTWRRSCRIENPFLSTAISLAEQGSTIAMASAMTATPLGIPPLARISLSV